MSDLYKGNHMRDTSHAYVAPDNRRYYLQGRADQRRVDWIAIGCLIALAIYLGWRD